MMYHICWVLCLLTFIFKQINSFSIGTFETSDIALNSTAFLADSSSWLVNSDPAINKTTICSGTYILGGYGLFDNSTSVSRAYTISTPHKSVFITLNFWLIGNWDERNVILIDLYNSSSFITTMAAVYAMYDPTTWTNSCNSQPTTQVTSLIITSAILSDFTIRLRLANTVSANMVYFGLRDVYIMLSNKTTGFTKYNNYPTGSPVYIYPSAWCAPGHFTYNLTDPSCQSCDSTCGTCIGSSANDCMSCASGYAYTGTTCGKCYSACQTCSGVASNQCISCKSGYSLTADHQCISPCASPFMILTQNNVSSCILPCNNDTTTPYSIPDTSQCLSSCPEPYTASLTNLIYENCVLVQSQASLDQVKGVSAANEVTSTASAIGAAIINLLNPGDPGSISANSLAKLLLYTRYLNVSHSVRVEYMFKAQKATSGSISLHLNLPPDAIHKCGTSDIPLVFSRYSVTSSFITNLWDTIFFISVLVTILLLVRSVALLSKKTKKEVFKEKMTDIKMYATNFFVLQCYGAFLDIFFFMGIQAVNSSLDEALPLFGLLLSLSASLGVVGYLYIHFSLIGKFQKLRKQANYTATCPQIETFNSKNVDFKGLYIDFKDGNYINQGCFLFLSLRSLVVGLITAFLYQYPLAQTILLLLISIAISLYLIIRRPIISKINLIQQISCELILVVVNVSLVISAISDNNGTNTRDHINQIGEVTVYCSMILGFVPTVALVAKLIVIAIDLYKKKKQPKPIKLENQASIIKTMDASGLNESSAIERRNTKQLRNNRIRPDVIKDSSIAIEDSIYLSSPMGESQDQISTSQHMEMPTSKKAYIQVKNYEPLTNPPDVKRSKASMKKAAGLVSKSVHISSQVTPSIKLQKLPSGKPSLGADSDNDNISFADTSNAQLIDEKSVTVKRRKTKMGKAELSDENSLELSPPVQPIDVKNTKVSRRKTRLQSVDDFTDTSPEVSPPTLSTNSKKDNLKRRATKLEENNLLDSTVPELSTSTKPVDEKNKRMEKRRTRVQSVDDDVSLSFELAREVQPVDATKSKLSDKKARLQSVDSSNEKPSERSPPRIQVIDDKGKKRKTKFGSEIGVVSEDNNDLSNSLADNKKAKNKKSSQKESVKEAPEQNKLQLKDTLSSTQIDTSGKIMDQVPMSRSRKLKERASMKDNEDDIGEWKKRS